MITSFLLFVVFSDIAFASFCVQHDGIISSSCIFMHLRAVLGTSFRGICIIEGLFRDIFSNQDKFVNHEIISRFLVLHQVCQGHCQQGLLGFRLSLGQVISRCLD